MTIRFGAREAQFVPRELEGTLILPLGLRLTIGGSWCSFSICSIISGRSRFFRCAGLLILILEVLEIGGPLGAGFNATAKALGSYGTGLASCAAFVVAGMVCLEILGLSCTGTVPKIAIFFLTLGSLDGLSGAGVGAADGDGGGVVGVGRLDADVVGESGVIVVCVGVIVVSLGPVCSGGGSCVGIL